MWIMVIFDLPVGTKGQRKAATRFRTFLLDQGFSMSQFSVYMRFCGGKDQADAYTKRIRRALPTAGLVQVLYFTDKQSSILLTNNMRAACPSRGGFRPKPMKIPNNMRCFNRGAAEHSANKTAPTTLKSKGWRLSEFSR